MVERLLLEKQQWDCSEEESQYRALHSYSTVLFNFVPEKFSNLVQVCKEVFVPISSLLLERL